MKLMFIGQNGSMGLRRFETYDCTIFTDEFGHLYVKWKTANGTCKCPYSSLKKMLENWLEVG